MDFPMFRRFEKGKIIAVLKKRPVIGPSASPVDRSVPIQKNTKLG